MKNRRFAVIAVAALLLVAPLAGCGGTTTTPSPTVTTSTITTSQVVTGTFIPSVTPPATSAVQYPDDLVVTPGGYAYRGNVHQQGEVNPWPEVATVQATLPIGTAQYRADITTNAGQTRNDLVTVSSGTFQSGGHTLDIYAGGVPAGITLEQSEGAALAGQAGKWVRIVIAANAAPGDYSFSFAVLVDGVFSGALPVTVHVVTETVNTPTAAVTTP